MEEPLEAAVPAVEPPRASVAQTPSSAVASPAEPAAVVSPPGAVAPAPTAAPEPEASHAPERIWRGLLFALPVIPVGVFVWVLIWQWGFMTALVMLFVAGGARMLYRKGAGGRIGFPGLWVIAGVTFVTLVLSFLGGIAADVAEYMGLSLANALGSSDFWAVYFDNVFANPKLWSAYGPDIFFALVFAGLGTFMTFRYVVLEARAGR